MFQRVFPVRYHFSNQTLQMAFFVAFATVIIALILPVSRTLVDPDIYLHVATGQWILQHLTIPFVDPYSYVMRGQPWVAHEWLSQVLMALMHDLSGWLGLVLIASLAFAVTLFIQYRFLASHLEPVQTAAFVIFSVAALLTHFIARPHVLVWPLLAVWISSLLTASEQGRRPSWWLLLVMVLWVNMHGSFVLGLVLLGFVALDSISRDFRSWPSWLRFVVLSMGACTLNPHGWRVFFFPFDLKSLTLLTEISEWAKPSLFQMNSLATTLVLIVFYVVLRRIRIPPVYLPLMAALIYQATSHGRYISLVVYLLPFFLRAGRKSKGTAVVTEADLYGTKQIPPTWQVFAAASLFIVAIPFAKDYQPVDTYTPKKAVDVILSSNLSGNGINFYGYGGYLIYRGIPVFIDGRADLYQDPHMTRYYTAARSKDPSAVRAVLDEFNIQWSLFPQEHPINKFFEQEPGWSKHYEDDQDVIFVRSAREQGKVP